MVGISRADESLERQLLDCLKKLYAVNHRHARILNLHYLGFTVAEICQRLEVTRNNLYSLLFRARTKLADCLETGEVE